MQAQTHYGNCYRCQKPGHWAKDCPERSGAAIANRLLSSALPGSTTDNEFPSTYCRCGKGWCLINASKKENENFGRKYYRCPGFGPENCNFFKWCNELKKDEILAAPPEVRFPTCRCKAGVCKLERERTGPHNGRYFFCCPIEKGEGACNFFLWQDEYAVPNGDQNEFSLNTDGPVNSHLMGDCDSLAPVLDLEGPGVDVASPMAPSPAQVQVEDGISGVRINNATENVPRDLAAAAAQASSPKSCAEPHGVQFKRPMIAPVISAAVDVIAAIPEATPSTESEKRMKLNPVSLRPPLRRLNFNDDVEIGDIEPCINQNEDLVAGFVDEVTGYLKDKLISSLVSLNPSHHQVMLEMANHAFAAMKTVDTEFKNRVMDYIARAASFVALENTNLNPSSAELNAKYDSEKLHLEELSSTEAGIKSSLTIKKESVCEARAEVCRLKDMLFVAEDKLITHEAEAETLEVELEQISVEIVECNETLQNVAQALKRDNELAAVKTAFEIAKAKLRA